MNQRIRLIGLFAFCIILVFGIAGCGGNNNHESGTNNVSNNDNSNGNAASPDNDAASGAEEAEIRFTWWGDTKRNEVYNAIVDRFEEEYPHITVKREFGGWGDYWDRLATQTAGDNAPDVVSMHQFYVSDYARRDALLDMQTVVDTGELDLSQFPESAIDSGRINDTLYMVPKGVTMPGWAYNTALFDELGVDYPDMNWTYEDFQATSAEIYENSGGEIWGSSDMSGGQLQPNFRYFARQSGEDLFTEDGQLGFSADTLTAWWTMWDELRQQGVIPDAATGTEYENAPLEQNLFVTGQTALHQIPANQIYLYQQQFETGEIHMVRMPQLPGGDNGEYIEGAYLSITKASEHPKEAALFIDFFVNSEQSLELFKVEQGSPANKEMGEFVKPLLDPAQARAVTFIQETLDYASPAVYAPIGVAEVETAFKDNATAIAYGEKSIKQAVADFMSNADDILN